MADVFISYKREERAKVERIARALQELGLSVWFDASLEGGGSFSAQINREVRAAKAVLVCWTPAAAHSEWVIGEADIGRTRGVLVPAFLAATDLPPPFNTIHAYNLMSWSGDHSDGEWLAALDRIGTLTGRSGLRHVALALAAGEPARAIGENAAGSMNRAPTAARPISGSISSSPIASMKRWPASLLSLTVLAALFAIFEIVGADVRSPHQGFIAFCIALALCAGAAGVFGRPTAAVSGPVAIWSAIIGAAGAYGLTFTAVAMGFYGSVFPLYMGPSADASWEIGAALPLLGGAYLFAAALPEPHGANWRLSWSRAGIFALLGLAFGIRHIAVFSGFFWWSFPTYAFAAFLGARLVLHRSAQALLVAIIVTVLELIFWYGPARYIRFELDSEETLHFTRIGWAFAAIAVAYCLGMLIAFGLTRTPWFRRGLGFGPKG